MAGAHVVPDRMLRRRDGRRLVPPVSLYYPLSPVERYCPECHGYGHMASQDVRLCGACDGIGRIFVDGGPSFGCKLTLADHDLGQVVTMGNGDRGRIVRHVARGTPTTEVALIDEFLDVEDASPTTYPSATGVRSALPATSQRDSRGEHRADDMLDPLRPRRIL